MRLASMLAVLAPLTLAAACGDDLTAPPPEEPPPPGGGGGVVPVERGHAGGGADVVKIVGDRAYVGVGPRLVVWDLAAAGGPALVGESAALPGDITALAVVGERAYVAERLDLDARIHVLDVADPAVITETAVFDVAGDTGTSVILDIEAGGAGLYVADQEQGVVELDLADPDAPAVVRVAPLAGAGDLTLVGTKLWVRAQGFIGSGFTVLDTTAALAELGGANYPSLAGAVVLPGDLVVTAGVDGIFAYDAADPSAPVELFHAGELEGGPFARALAATGTTAWIPAEDGLHVLDLADPATPVHTGPIAAPTTGVDAAAVGGGHVAIVTDRGRLVAWDAAAPMAPPADLQVTLCADCTDVAVESATLLVTDIVGGLRTAALADLAGRGTSPAVPSDRPDGLAFVFEGVDVEGGRAYVADWLSGLRIYDVATPGAITQLGSLVTGGMPSGVDVVGDRAYVVESTNGGALRVIDVGDPTAPVELGAIATSKAMAVQVRDGIAYVADASLFEGGGLRLFDVSNPAAIRALGTYDAGCSDALDVALAGDHALVACAGGGFHVVDVTDPMAPTRAAVVPTPSAIGSAWSVATWGGHAALGHDQGVTLVRLAEPTAPAAFAELPTAGPVRRLAIPARARIVAACGRAGVYQWQLGD